MTITPTVLRSVRPYSATFAQAHPQAQAPRKEEDEYYEQDVREEQEEERGAMSRRLAEMTEEVLEGGGRSARKAVEEAGFDEELKRKLEERIAGTGATVGAGNTKDMQRARSLVDLPVGLNPTHEGSLGKVALARTCPVET